MAQDWTVQDYDDLIAHVLVNHSTRYDFERQEAGSSVIWIVYRKGETIELGRWTISRTPGQYLEASLDSHATSTERAVKAAIQAQGDLSEDEMSRHREFMSLEQAILNWQDIVFQVRERQAADSKLSDRDKMIADMWFEGYSAPDIGEAVGLSGGTTRNIVTNLRKQLGVSRIPFHRR